MEGSSAAGCSGCKKDVEWKKEGVSMPLNSPSALSRQQLLLGGGAGVLFDSCFDLFCCLPLVSATAVL
eukprot:3825678-Rhodomonas_salina.1